MSKSSSEKNLPGHISYFICNLIFWFLKGDFFVCCGGVVLAECRLRQELCRDRRVQRRRDHRSHFQRSSVIRRWN